MGDGSRASRCDTNALPARCCGCRLEPRCAYHMAGLVSIRRPVFLRLWPMLSLLVFFVPESLKTLRNNKLYSLWQPLAYARGSEGAPTATVGAGTRYCLTAPYFFVELPYSAPWAVQPDRTVCVS